MAPPRLQELEIFMLIRENQGKKERSRPSILHKSFWTAYI
jgi:hypothetical protein